MGKNNDCLLPNQFDYHLRNQYDQKHNIIQYIFLNLPLIIEILAFQQNDPPLRHQGLTNEKRVKTHFDMKVLILFL